ncbi:uncharacterized protein BDR25DRAFT_361076 [Lindgomyces ingoldianus]|uniref:Uncharacterized protein n=1 Tax=Lindgomyces ingoldianus TaxID=673940 RepID=A0ACB6QD52_9PLEO|nr:uncharacterized protein BDR25DRAFT_361076 [Lindgomyces ingoldianus]KAF2464844.1 hypothetical protein BDR25DRAFT_361076 [Lindgomyces ingoldianus]
MVTQPLSRRNIVTGDQKNDNIFDMNIKPRSRTETTIRGRDDLRFTGTKKKQAAKLLKGIYSSRKIDIPISLRYFFKNHDDTEIGESWKPRRVNQQSLMIDGEPAGELGVTTGEERKASLETTSSQSPNSATGVEEDAVLCLFHCIPNLFFLFIMIIRFFWFDTTVAQILLAHTLSPQFEVEQSANHGVQRPREQIPSLQYLTNQGNLLQDVDMMLQESY